MLTVKRQFFCETDTKGAGIYLYHIHAVEYISTKKMVLLKPRPLAGLFVSRHLGLVVLKDT